MLMTRGCGCDGSVSALRNRRVARRGIAPPRAHEVDRGAGGIEGSAEVAPATLDANVGLIDTPGRVGGLAMTAQPLLQFWTVALAPAPDGRVVRLQAALAEQIFDITDESEYRRYQRTAHRISPGSVCHHLKIAGRIACSMISPGYQPSSPTIATQSYQLCSLPSCGRYPFRVLLRQRSDAEEPGQGSHSPPAAALSGSPGRLRVQRLASVLLNAVSGCATLLYYHNSGVFYGRSANWVLVEIRRAPQTTVSPTRRAPSR